MKRLILILVVCGFSAPAFAADSDLYIYPAGGQSDDQLDQDRYQCYTWASRETGYDPTVQSDDGKIVRVPVGKNDKAGATATGAIIGAVAGAAIGAGERRGGAGRGAVIGGTAGTVIGAVIEDSGRKEAREAAEAEAAEIADSQAEARARATDYRRAFSACLEGRGYVVR